jgi:catechol 2,3-dioxygenase-like lactoylglutathione lyase family enzyme
LGAGLLTLVVTDLHATIEANRGQRAFEMAEAGVEVATAPTRVGDVAAVCFVRDPDGNWIEFAQRAALAGPLPDLDS